MLKNIVQIVGTTGVGKSQLAVELATALNGEIINSDSMQVYKGLDILTNKLSLIEQQGIPHHLLGFLDQRFEYSVPAYARDARKIIEDVQTRSRLAVVVGGTAYYSTALLFEDILPSLSEPTGRVPTDPRLELDTKQLYEALERVDPEMAKRWHPNDRRKIRRSLEIYYSTGKKQSELYRDQRMSGRITSNKLLYRTLILWLWSEQDALDARLNARVDDMIRAGLFEEIRSMKASEGQQPLDFTRGAFQAIGYKEFQDYLNSGTENDRDKGTDAMKSATRQYARKQIKWIRNKLLLQCNQGGRDLVVCMLDATDLHSWALNVRDLGLRLTQSFLAGHEIDMTSLSPKAAVLLRPRRDIEFSANTNQWTQTKCTVCVDRNGACFTAIGQAAWNDHLGSRMHLGKLRRQKKLREYEAWKQNLDSAKIAIFEGGT